jgi:methionine-rich copper-binding protein CopC
MIVKTKSALVAAAFALILTLAGTTGASAHAEPVRANPPIDGSVATSTSQVEIWFGEEATDATTIKVYAPDGVRVDLGNSTLDLQDPQREHVTVGLTPHLDPGTYRVEWSSVSATDGDAANGQFTFTIGSGTPVASPAAGSPVASPVVGTPAAPVIGPPAETMVAANVTPAPTATVIPEQYKTNKIDDQALAIAIGAGVLAAAAIYLFWRWLKPKNPVV